MNEDILNEIRSKTDIVETIRSYIPVIKKGKSFAAVCPFHDDHNPSMSISPDKQIYKCFVCGAGGNVFSFVRDFEKITFNEAVERLAIQAGIQLDSSFSQNKVQIDPIRQGYYDTLDEYLRFVKYNLASTEGNEARAYLEKRGLNQEQIQKFEIGYNPADHKANDFLEAKGYDIEKRTQSNLVRVNEFGVKDVFENRITFPIHSASGQVLGFSARTLDPSHPSKYINTAETDIYQKGKLLYNLHRAKQAIKSQQFIILVEGVMDVIAYDKAGFENVVASLGTALTIDQIRLLKNNSLNIYLSYDSDNAGQMATQKIGRLLSEQGFKVFVCQNNLAKDIDETLQKHGLKAVQNIVEAKKSFVEYLFDSSMNRLDLENYSQKKEFARLMMLELISIKDAFDQSHMKNRIMDVTGFTEDQLDLLVPQTQKPKTKIRRSENLRKVLKQNELSDWAEKEILGQMLVSQNAMQVFRKELGYFVDDLYQKCALKIMHYYRHHDSIVVADFINTLDSSAAIECITQIVESDIYYNSYSEKALMDAIIQVKINTIDIQIDQFKQEHKEALVLDSNPDLMIQYQSLIKQRRDYLKKKGESNGK